MIPATTRRVEQNTADDINRERRQEIAESLRYHAVRPHEIPARLAELEREWDIERALEANAAGVALGGLVLAALVDRRFMLVPLGVAGFLMQHAIQGWCPPLPLLRRLGFRTASEIAEERCGLQMLRGEYRSLTPRAASSASWLEQVEQAHEGVEA